jgi:hypothetical protein
MKSNYSLLLGWISSYTDAALFRRKKDALLALIKKYTRDLEQQLLINALQLKEQQLTVA